MKKVITVFFLFALLFFVSCEEEEPSNLDIESDEDSLIDDEADDADCVEDSVFPTKETMRKRIDEAWGEAPDKSDRLEIFDLIWDTLGVGYAGFVTGHVDWDEIKSRYRPEVEKADSFGRFYSLMSNIFREIQDGHTYIYGTTVCSSIETDITLNKRPPVFVTSTIETNIGACVTVDENDQLLVYEVDPNNPAGLEPGDIIVGYDGKSWKELLELIFEWELPICGANFSSNEAQEFLLQRTVVSNAHLFKDLNFKKYGSEEVNSYKTDDIQLFKTEIRCTEQLLVKDGPEPVDNDQQVSWGRLPNSNIGYIYISGYTLGVSSEFEKAVSELMDTDGLIIDERYNFGGWGGEQTAAALLFNEDVPEKLHCRMRADSYDYLAMDFDDVLYDGIFSLKADTQTFYDKPIAVLVAPLGVSGGDVFPYLMSFHPKAKRFGMATSGSFGALRPWLSQTPDPIIDDFYVGYTNCVFYDDDKNLWQAKEESPEVEVWFNQEDVRNGVDTVAQAAIDWIGEELN